MFSSVGKGSFAEVFACRRRSDGACLAIKIIDMFRMESKEVEASNREVKCGTLNRVCGTLKRVCGTLKSVLWYFQEGDVLL